MNFEFATATRIIFGEGKINEVERIAPDMGQRAVVITDSAIERARPLLDILDRLQIAYVTFSIDQEPTVDMAREGVHKLREGEAQFVISIGGGSVIDAGKAIAALATNPGDPLDYLEIIGKGHKLGNPPLPFIAIPTTAGTGAEVTRNAVLASPEHQRKVSLRSPLMLPKVAIIDPELTYSMPPAVTASTGMDALTQVIEPYVSWLANPLTDGIALQGIQFGARALRRAYSDGADTEARRDMALTSLFGGLALANAKLGAVHGFAGVLGGMSHAPHGAICAVLLPPVMAVNVKALMARDPDNPALLRYTKLARLLTGDEHATSDDGVQWVQQLGQDLQIPSLASYGVQPADFPTIIEKSSRSSSMKGNPIQLTDEELGEILEVATK